MIEDVQNGVASTRTLKRFLLKNHGEKCWSCGITEWNDKPIGFELEHIDGNSENNELNNLSILCPNCHSQTDTYKNKNKGNGRHSRRIRYSDGKSY
jgi:Zn finger protein HypA/HybF involved in hydrogenase expression